MKENLLKGKKESCHGNLDDIGTSKAAMHFYFIVHLALLKPQREKKRTRRAQEEQLGSLFREFCSVSYPSPLRATVSGLNQRCSMCDPVYVLRRGND